MSGRIFFKLSFSKSYEERQGMKYSIYDSDNFTWNVDGKGELTVSRTDGSNEIILSVNMNDVTGVDLLEL